MSLHLVLTIGLHDQRYHGASEWPPAPVRVFQALVAGAARGQALYAERLATLEWLESLPPPIVVAPAKKRGARVELFVPNNDLDAVGGDPKKIGEIRTKKVVEPWLLEGDASFTYVWQVQEPTAHCEAMTPLAEDLYQLGRGVDMAWATAEVLEEEELQARLDSLGGQLFRPSPGEGELQLPCPTPGTLASLTARHAAMHNRLTHQGQGKGARTLFSQPPKPVFAPVAYESPPSRRVFELRDSLSPTKFWPWPLHKAAALIQLIRDGVAARLTEALPDAADLVQQFLIGRTPESATSSQKALRIKLIPLPSIGHEHADNAIRRIVVEVPNGCPLRAADVYWAISGFEKVDPTSGELGPFMLTEASAPNAMLDHFISEGGSTTWSSTTAVVLPEGARRRRIDPAHQREQSKGAQEVLAEEARAMTAVKDALRHAQVPAQALAIRVQRTPFDPHGASASAFAEGTRFDKHQLWHVEVTLNKAIPGPFVLGNGRFLGLGVMAPISESQGVFTFHVTDGLSDAVNPEEIARALRRATMARVQDLLGPREPLPEFFSGHEAATSRATSEAHLHFVFEPATNSLYVLAPHVVMRRNPYREEREHLTQLQLALASFTQLRAGKSGLLTLEACSPLGHEVNPLFGTSHTWQSSTPYQVSRHAKKVTAEEALIVDLKSECARRKLPEPDAVDVQTLRGIRGEGLTGFVQIRFARAVQGPLLLGRSRHLGGGAFSPVTE